jgi:hypothetical protein
MEYDLYDEYPSFSEDFGAKPRNLDYLGYAPCPFRKEMQRQMHPYFKRMEAEFGKLEWYSPSGCGGHDDPYDLIWKNGTEETMAGVMSDGGSSDYFKKEGYEKWIKSGIFGPIDKSHLTIRSEFKAAGIEDPLQAMHVYAAFPTLIMVDKEKLGDRPMPKAWKDLGDPIYKNDVIISGYRNDASDILLFNTWKNYGDEGLRAVARNIKDYWSPAQMAKTAGSGNPAGAALYSLNLFFARSHRFDDKVELVWPEEGVWFNPLMLLAKRNRRPVSQLPIDFILSRDWALFLDSIGVIPVHEYEGLKPLPGKVDWLGFDFYRNCDIDALRIELNKIFSEAATPVCS